MKTGEIQGFQQFSTAYIRLEETEKKKT